MTKDNGGEEPLSHNVYFLATMLDPQFGLNWLDLDVTNRINQELQTSSEENTDRYTHIHFT